jgi:hypothetical protein
MGPIGGHGEDRGLQPSFVAEWGAEEAAVLEGFFFLLLDLLMWSSFSRIAARRKAETVQGSRVVRWFRPSIASSISSIRSAGMRVWTTGLPLLLIGGSVAGPGRVKSEMDGGFSVATSPGVGDRFREGCTVDNRRLLSLLDEQEIESRPVRPSPAEFVGLPLVLPAADVQRLGAEHPASA